jgi:biopolymer transport protein ExbD
MAGGGGGQTTVTASPALTQFDTFIPRRRLTEDAHFDITAMIDLVFMMNIFFLVTSLTKSMAGMDLPTATLCKPANEAECVVIMVRATHDREIPQVSVAGGDFVDWEADVHEIDERILDGIELGVREGRNRVLIKAEKKIPLRHIARIASLTGSVAGAEPLFAVMELDPQGK